MSVDFGPGGLGGAYPYTPPQGGGGGFANPMTTLGDIIVGGALGVPTRLGIGAEGTQPTVVGGVLTYTEPTVYTAGATTAEPMTGTGWTTTQPSDVTATWGGGKLTLNAPTGAVTITFVTSDTTRLGASASQWDFCVRVDIVAGDGVAPAAQALFGFYTDDNNFILLSYKLDDRNVGLFTKAGGSETNHGFVAGPSSGDATGAQLWFRTSRLISGEVAVWWGVGVAGALPTAWTRTHLIDRPALTLAVPTTCSVYAGMGWFGLGPLSATTTVDVLAIRTSWQGSL